MADQATSQRYRFGVFEADVSTGELRKHGVRIKLNAQPFQVLILLLARPGEVLTREQIYRELWPDGTFVDSEHGVNSAVNRLRDALGDTAGNPRFVETLSRRGYRFVAPVERIEAGQVLVPRVVDSTTEAEDIPSVAEPDLASFKGGGILSSPDELPKTSYSVVQTLFVLFQLMYVGFYVGALANLPEIEGLLSALPKATLIFMVSNRHRGDIDSGPCIPAFRGFVSSAQGTRKDPENLAVLCCHSMCCGRFRRSCFYITSTLAWLSRVRLFLSIHPLRNVRLS